MREQVPSMERFLGERQPIPPRVVHCGSVFSREQLVVVAIAAWLCAKLLGAELLGAEPGREASLRRVFVGMIRSVGHVGLRLLVRLAVHTFQSKQRSKILRRSDPGFPNDPASSAELQGEQAAFANFSIQFPMFARR